MNNNYDFHVKKRSHLALSCLASLGVAATTISAVMATPKAMANIHEDSRKNHNGDPNAYTKKEAIKSAWKYYISSAIIGGATIGCIIGTNILNSHQQMAFASAYAIVQKSYDEYKKKVKELYGEEAHINITDSIVKEKCENKIICTPGIFVGSTSLDFGESNEPEVIRTFYDSYSERYFESSIEKVIQAEYHLNRNFMFSGITTPNDFYDLLGLEKIKGGDDVGWSSMDGDIYWVDFDHRKTTLEDGMEIYIIDMVNYPTAYYLENA